MKKLILAVSLVVTAVFAASKSGLADGISPCDRETGKDCFTAPCDRTTGVDCFTAE